MKSYSSEDNILNAIIKILSIKTNNPQNIVYQVMMLPNSQYNCLFNQLSVELNIQINTVCMLFTRLSLQHLQIKNENKYQSQPELVVLTLNQTKLITETRQMSHDKILPSQFKQDFSLTLRKLIIDYDQTAGQMTDKQLCLCLTSYFSIQSQKLFWARMHEEIAYKTCYQLKQYFQKSFSKCKFEKISDNDKQRIVDITYAMPQRKPFEIVDAFFAENSKKAYFRREVLMMVQYIQKTAK
ncbi:Hypothetical_protein [Hexamita inflata]|uniref:Hypothetical_protein n=1 Tax=Hexamita inflata TaxID=28002 RepID=A0AA86RLT0_9EUKA|nr:Hypothetical protein HINF_LOCUS56440 [Hexamita inflata]